MKRFLYEVPIVEKNGLSRPRIPKHLGYVAIHYDKENGIAKIKVGIGAHNYLKNRKYVKFFGEM